MSKIDLEKQQRELSRLREELSRLNRDFDAARQRLGLKPEDEVAAPGGALPEALEKAMAEAAKQAKAASERDVLALKSETEEAPAFHAPRGRRGSIAI